MIRHFAALLIIFATAVNMVSYTVSTAAASASHHQTQDGENDSEAESESESENEMSHEEYLPSFLKLSFFSSLLKISFSNLEMPLRSISLGFLGKPPRA